MFVGFGLMALIAYGAFYLTLFLFAGWLIGLILLGVLVYSYGVTVVGYIRKGKSAEALAMVVVPIGAQLIGVLAARGDAYDMRWFFDNGNGGEILLVFIFTWVFPFVAFFLTFRDSLAAKWVALPFYLLPTYIWTWIIINWHSIYHR